MPGKHRLEFLNHAAIDKDIKRYMYDMYKAHEEFPFVLKDVNNVEEETYAWIEACVPKQLVSRSNAESWANALMVGFNRRKLDILTKAAHARGEFP